MLTTLSAFLIEIIAAVVLVPLVLYVGKKLKNYIFNKRFEIRMAQVYRIYDEIYKLREYFDSDRVLLLKTTNGGGLPGPGKVLYATIVAEVDAPTANYKELREEWQNRLIDHDYIRMLERVYIDGEILNVVAEMEEHSMLRGAYEKLGITHTKVIKIGIHNNAFYYLSISCKDECISTPAKEYTVNTAIQNIKKLLN